VTEGLRDGDHRDVDSARTNDPFSNVRKTRCDIDGRHAATDATT
jgi:hypothetical protein